MSEREVEPYGVLGAFGKVYFDRIRSRPQILAILCDPRFASKPVKAGTCATERIVPETYRSGDVVGFIKKGNKQTRHHRGTGGERCAFVTCQEWQASQRVEKLTDGRAQITFSVSDIDEVVRWALGFGADARVIAPSEAVDRAREISSKIAGSYRSASTG